MWEYIRSHDLQNPDNRREILADDKLRRIFGKEKVTMFEMNKRKAPYKFESGFLQRRVRKLSVPA